MKKYAFSLGETLTTLLIIGAIASMLIPSLQSNVSKQKYLSMLKKLYSSFSVNIKTVLANGNCGTISCLRRYGNNESNDPYKKYQHNGVFADTAYFNVTKECPSCIEKGSVMPAEMKAINGSSKGESKDDNPANFTTYQLANGSVMALYDFEENCTEDSYIKYDNDNISICGIVVFDVNGPKSPNTPGRDRFAYFITDEPLNDSFLVPVGYNKNDKSKKITSKFGNGDCDVKNTQDGYNCTAKVMIDGWKMDY